MLTHTSASDVAGKEVDNVRRRHDNQNVPRWRVRLIGFVLIAALGWSATTCADTVWTGGMKINEMTCARSDEAPQPNGAMTCCKASTDDQQSTAAKLFNFAPPQMQLVRLVNDAPMAVVIPGLAKLVGDGYTPRPLQLDIPTYLLDSVFLL